MPTDPLSILDFIRTSTSRPLKPKELARELGISKGSYMSFKQSLRHLIDCGELVKLKGGRIGVAAQMDVLVGKLEVTRGGTGFVAREGGGQDIMIPARDLSTAFDSDRVMVRLAGKRQGRQTGAVIKVLERAQRRIVGLFKQAGHFNYIVPDNPKIHRDIYIPDAAVADARPGDKVVAELVVWDDPYLNPEGRVLERLGRPTDPGVDMLTVIKSYDFPEAFSPDAISAAEQAAAMMTPEVQAERLDITNQVVYTIDPADAKDHDDAISIEREGSGYRLGVHIADVSFFVEEGSLLDTEAFERGNSVYLPGTVIPMLPEVLSNDICSLRPNRRRLAHSVFMRFDGSGKMLSWELADTLIKSAAKLSYEDVQQFFDGEPAGARIKRVAESLSLARELARKLTARRFAEGSLDFDLPEAHIDLGPDGEVLDIRNKVRLESHRLIEEFMLAANRAVALEIFRAGEPCLYRVHGRPEMDKLEAFSSMMKRLGHKFPVSPTIKPVQFARFLESVKGTPEADFINELMLRSMQKAVYQQNNIGHFGLAFKHYAHFTSPIRRYPDLLVHRLVRHLKTGKYPPAFAKRIGGVIDHVGAHCSETERTAESAERLAVKIKQVAYMAGKLGEEYDGVITGVIPAGFFVRINNLGVEGMVRMSSIDDDYYQFDEHNYRIIGRRFGRTYRLGDAVHVGVQKVNRERNEIDFFLTKLEQRKESQRKGMRRSHSGRRR